MTGLRVETAKSWFEKLGGSEVIDIGAFPFRLRVVIAGPLVTPRHSLFEGFLDMGSGLISQIIRHEPLELSEKSELLFVLPERWMSVHEQRYFLYRLRSHPDVSLIKSVDIVTQNPLIAGGIPGNLVKFDVPVTDPEASIIDQDF